MDPDAVFTIAPSKVRGSLCIGKGGKLEVKTDESMAKASGGDLVAWVNDSEKYAWRIERARIGSTYFPGYFITPADGVLKSIYFKEGTLTGMDACCLSSGSMSDWNVFQATFMLIPIASLNYTNLSNSQFHTTQKAEELKLGKTNRDWLGKLKDEEMEINQLWIPGTLHSACHVKHHLLPIELKMRDQAFTIIDQLNLGIRYLDLRLRHAGGALFCHKGVFYLEETWLGLLKKLVDWLTANPTEFILAVVREEHEPETTGFNTTWGGLIHSGLGTMPDGMVWTRGFIPTLREARGKLIMMAAPATNLNFIPWGGVHSTDAEFYIQDLWDGPSFAEKWKAFIQLWAKAITETTPQQFFINHLTAYASHPLKGSPNYYSETLNSYVLSSPPPLTSLFLEGNTGQFSVTRVAEK